MIPYVPPEVNEPMFCVGVCICVIVSVLGASQSTLNQRQAVISHHVQHTHSMQSLCMFVCACGFAVCVCTFVE